MNERIKALAERATQKYDRLGIEIPFAQPDLELFAQLIIKECANVARDVDNYNPMGASFGHAVAVDIEEHFGVDT